MQYYQCFVCREWSGTVSRCFSDVHLCLPCYVDVLEVRQARGCDDQSQSLTKPKLREGPDQRPDPLHPGQLDMFNA